MTTAMYINLEQVVKEYIGEADYTSASFLRLYQLAIRGYDDLWQDVIGKPKTRVLKVLPNNVVELPSDYINWIKVGVVNESGEVATLRMNNNLTAHAATDADRLNNIQPTAGVQVYDPVSSDFRNYYDDLSHREFNLFGTPAGTQNLGEFRVLEEEAVIILDKSFGASEIVLEYLASPYEKDKPVFVPVQAREALLAWVAWRDIVNKASSRRVNSGEKVMRKREYYHQRKLARRRITATRRGQLNDTVRLNSNLVLKA